MSIHSGTCRLVVVIGSLVFKIPRVRLFKILKLVLKLDFATVHVWWDAYLGFRGLVENIREARIYYAIRHKLLAPVYLPFLFVNIYPYKERVGKSNLHISYLIRKGIEETEDEQYFKMFRECSHTLAGNENLAFDGERVTLVDYGQAGMYEFILKYGDRYEQLLLSVFT